MKLLILALLLLYWSTANVIPGAVSPLVGAERLGNATGNLSPSSSGQATWCAPTPTQCQSWGGDAHLGAVPSFRWGDPEYLARVCHDGHCTVVRVVSYCGCPGNRIIDLSPAAFRELAPLSRGVIPVTLSRVEAPATDTE